MSDNETVFKVGDVVRLKSGGPKMTVIDINGESHSQISVAWFVDDGDLRSTSGPAASLELVKETP